MARGSTDSGENRRRTWLIGDLDADAYDAYFERLAQQGADVHGEARLVASFHPRSVLDAGCGTGRVARELARQGIEVVGVDREADMIEVARQNAPDIEWHRTDLADLDLGRTFDLAVTAGNVMIFVTPGTEEQVVAALARHLAPGGLLVAGFQLGHSLTIDAYDALAHAAGLRLRHRWSTWERAPWHPGCTYAVSVHERTRAAAP